MKKNIVILLAVMALGVGSAFGAEGKGDKAGQADETGMNIGALLGIGLNAGNDLQFGLTGTYKMNPYWGAGLYFTYSGDTITGTPIVTKNSNMTIAPELSYFFDEALAGLRLGGKVGIATTSTTITGSPIVSANTDTSSTNVIFGPHIGYDYPLGGGLSLGAEYNLLLTTATGGGSSSNLLGALKYWF